MNPALKFRKKPVVIEAVRFGLQEYGDNPLTFEHVPAWLAQAIDEGAIQPVFRGEDYWYLTVKTLEGPMTAGPGDWIIRGVEGELYPCKASVFDKTYEAVEPDTRTFADQQGSPA